MHTSLAAQRRTGGEILADALLAHGVERAFAVCGESFLPLLDALHDRPQLALISCRHEAGAAVMAEATGKLLGRPGVCLVSRGPGVCHATIGLHTALQDSTPLVMLGGQVPRSYTDREAQQEIDYRRMLAPLTKWVATIDRVERIPEFMQRAFRVAQSARPGPVALILPEDMLEDRADVVDCPPAPLPRPAPRGEDMAELRELLEASQRPIVIAGGSAWTDAACAELGRFVARNDLPIACSYRRLDLVATDHDCFVGELAVSTNRELLERLRRADLVVAIGTRLSEPTTQDYTLLALPQPQAKLVHVHPAAEEIGSMYRPTLAIQAAPSDFTRALAAMAPVSSSHRTAWRAELRRIFIDDSTPRPARHPLEPALALRWLRDALPRDAIVTFDAGAFTGWPQRFLSFGRPARVLAPASGAMNYAIHAGIAACLAHPDARVVACVGDGGFTMGEAELATARRYGAKPIVLLFNNDRFASVHIHQQRRYPGRALGTDLTNPDFALLARSYGAHSERVTRTDEFPAAWTRAVECGTAAVIELELAAEQLSSRLDASDLPGR